MQNMMEIGSADNVDSNAFEYVACQKLIAFSVQALFWTALTGIAN